MEKSLKHDLTPKQEKLLASFDLNETQRAKVRDIWETEKTAGKIPLIFYGTYLVMLFLIAGLSSQLFYPDERIANLTIFFTWIYYPGSYLLIILAWSASLFILAVYKNGIEKPAEERPKNFSDTEKIYYRSALNQQTMFVWSGKKNIESFFSLIAHSSICVLLVMNDHFVAAFIVVVYLILVNVLFIATLKMFTQSVLDKLSNQTIATDQNGQVIKVDVLPKALN